MSIALHEIGVDGPTLLPGMVDHEALDAVVISTRKMYARNGFESPWTCYLAVEGNECVGTCGFTGKPEAGEVEIAYFTFSGNEGRGVATQMARALLDIAREAALEGVDVIAHTLPVEGPSASILSKTGFRCIGVIEHAEDGTVWKWVVA